MPTLPDIENVDSGEGEKREDLQKEKYFTFHFLPDANFSGFHKKENQELFEKWYLFSSY